MALNPAIPALFAAGAVLAFMRRASARLFLSAPAGSEELPRADLFVPTAAEIDIVARTIWGEARGGGREGMAGVANVIRNRWDAVQAGRVTAARWGGTWAEIVRKPAQFSAWNAGDPNRAKLQAVTDADANFRAARDIAVGAIRGTLIDRTQGADHYHAQYAEPSWARDMFRTVQIAGHVFYREWA